MLTTDLIRARVYQGSIIPRFLKADNRSIDRADSLIKCFRDHVHKTQGELEEAITRTIGDGTDYVLWRGLAKLLYDRCELEIRSPVACEDLRRVIFEEEALRHPVALGPEEGAEGQPPRGAARRAEVLEAAAKRLNLTPAEVEALMYADHEDAQILHKFEPISAEDLLNRYNVSLVQSILLRAVEMRVLFKPDKPSRLRQLFRFIKFYRLMYQVAPAGGGAYFLTLDGPVSLFRMSQKYGLQLACFFPGLLLSHDFEMEADVLWGKDGQSVTLRIDDTAGLSSHYRDDGHYVSEEGRWLEDRWAQLKLPWSLVREGPPIDLGGKAVIVPDFTLRGPDGREAYLEIVGFWRKGYLESRLQLIRNFGPPNLILAISDRLRVSEEDLSDLPARVFPYKGALPAKDIFSLAESCALLPTGAARLAARSSVVAVPAAEPAPPKRGKSKEAATQAAESPSVEVTRDTPKRGKTAQHEPSTETKPASHANHETSASHTSPAAHEAPAAPAKRGRKAATTAPETAPTSAANSERAPSAEVPEKATKTRAPRTTKAAPKP
jgi:hypothetical protein